MPKPLKTLIIIALYFYGMHIGSHNWEDFFPFTNEHSKSGMPIPIVEYSVHH